VGLREVEVTTLTEVPVDRIGVRAREIDPVRLLLTLLAAPLIVLGWSAAKLWGALAWSLAAVQVGWEEGRTSRVPRPAGDG
jgi:hypothetical protein